MKRSERKPIHLMFFFFAGKSWRMLSLVSRHGVFVGQNSSSNPQTPRVRDTLKCELGKKEVQTPDVVLFSESRVYTQMREVYIHK